MTVDDLFKDFVYGIMPALLSLAIVYLSRISTSLNELRISFAKVLEQVGDHERRIDRLEQAPRSKPR